VESCFDWLHLEVFLIFFFKLVDGMVIGNAIRSGSKYAYAQFLVLLTTCSDAEHFRVFGIVT